MYSSLQACCWWKLVLKWIITNTPLKKIRWVSGWTRTPSQRECLSGWPLFSPCPPRFATISILHNSTVKTNCGRKIISCYFLKHVNFFVLVRQLKRDLAKLKKLYWIESLSSYCHLPLPAIISRVTKSTTQQFLCIIWQFTVMLELNQICSDKWNLGPTASCLLHQGHRRLDRRLPGILRYCKQLWCWSQIFVCQGFVFCALLEFALVNYASRFSTTYFHNFHNQHMLHLHLLHHHHHDQDHHDDDHQVRHAARARSREDWPG